MFIIKVKNSHRQKPTEKPDDTVFSMTAVLDQEMPLREEVKEERQYEPDPEKQMMMLEDQLEDNRKTLI